MKKISVSYLGVEDLEKTISDLSLTDCDYIHMDVMDGKYVQNKTLSYGDIKDIGYYTKKRLDIHFMVSKPSKYIDDYASLNAEYMAIHLDILEDVNKDIDLIKRYGIKVGLVLNPDDKIDLIKPYLDKIDMVLIMSVYPGLPGQKFIKDVLDKVTKLKKEIKKINKDILISIDGGINKDTVKLCKDIDIIVSGSFITKSDNYQKSIDILRKN